MGLEDLDPFAILDAEVERLDRYLTGLDDCAWLRPSRCAGWTVRDLLAHLAGEETYNQACLHSDAGCLSARMKYEGAATLEDFNDWAVRTRRDRSVADVLDEWRTKSAATRRRVRSLGRDATLPTTSGPYPVGLLVFHYAAEYAIHADDVGTAPDPAAPERVCWRTRVALFALAESGAPVAVEPDGDGGYVVHNTTAWATLTPCEFVAATAGRLATATLDPGLRDDLRCLA